MEPLTQLFRSTIENFPSLLLEHRVKLADITSEKEVLGLTDDEILQSEDVFPRRYELETLRYWRNNGASTVFRPKQTCLYKYIPNDVAPIPIGA